MTPRIFTLPVGMCICRDVNCTVPYGECHCLCGGKTTVSKYGRKSRGIVNGEPRVFIKGHRSDKRDAVVHPDNPKIKAIALTRGQVAHVSAHRYEHLARWKWCAKWNEKTKTYYACRTSRSHEGPKRTIFMHQEILGIDGSDSMECDHKNPAETLNNTDDNLRIGNHKQQSYNRRKHRDNTSGYKCVSLCQHTGRWVAKICVDGKQMYIGRYPTPEDAARAYDTAAIRLHGEFACLNFPEEH